ncbi:MAG: hypothetical protein ACTSR8_16205 [Promethearchaeota archaeon]
MVNSLVNNNMLLIIPSWNRVLGYPTFGTYINQNVATLDQDPLIFFGGLESTIQTESGVLHNIFGLGYYFLKFEIEGRRGTYITDHRILTGLILSDFVYDYLASSKSITLENDPDVLITEDIIKVPTELSFKLDTQITFIKGALMRNVFIPYKDVILDFIQKVREPDNYRIDLSGHALLSTQREKYNNILVSNKMVNYKGGLYLNPTAGVENIITGADDFLEKYFSTEELTKLEKKISNLKYIISGLEFEPTYLFSIIENLSKKLVTGTIPVQLDTQAVLNTKSHILSTAENRISQIAPWPEEFQRVKKKPLIHEKPSTVILSPNTSKSESNQPLATFQEPEREENFELRLMKSTKVKSKTLPAAPEGDIEEIMLYLQYVIEEEYEMQAIGEAFDRARDNLRKIVLQASYLWDMSKMANLYKKKPPGLGLPLKEKVQLLRKIEGWIGTIGSEILKGQP